MPLKKHLRIVKGLWCPFKIITHLHSFNLVSFALTERGGQSFMKENTAGGQTFIHKF